MPEATITYGKSLSQNSQNLFTALNKGTIPSKDLSSAIFVFQFACMGNYYASRLK